MERWHTEACLPGGGAGAGRCGGARQGARRCTHAAPPCSATSGSAAQLARQYCTAASEGGAEGGQMSMDVPELARASMNSVLSHKQ